MVETLEAKLFEVVPLRENVSLENAKVPHYIVSQEGFYLRKPTLLGTCVIKEKRPPKTLASIGKFKEGVFYFGAEPIHKTVIAKALDFFKLVLEKRGSEAEVILLYNTELKRWRLFVPYQIAEYTGVDSIYDPADIPEGWDVAGTIHSHCDFEAFHSSTDTADASSFNGLHITMGKINTKPEFAAMVMVNEIDFHYNDESLSLCADTSDLNSARAPREWLKYFKTMKEIKELKWTSLTPLQLDEWEKEVYGTWDKRNRKGTKTTSWNNQAWGKDYLSMTDEEWDAILGSSGKSDYKSDNKYPLDTRWSQQFKKYLPREAIANNGDVHTMFFEKVIGEELERLHELALEYGIFLQYDMLNLSTVDKGTNGK